MHRFPSIGLIVVGAACVVFSWGPLGNLFEDYQDSPVSTYLVLGVPPLAIGLICIVVGIQGLVRRQDSPEQ